MNCSTCTLTPNFNYVTNIKIKSLNKDDIEFNKDALIYMILNESKYIKIIENVQMAAKYKKDNKRYFIRFNNKLMNSRDIILAKNQIFTYEQYKNHIRYKLYQDGYNNITMNVINNCSSESNSLIKFKRLKGINSFVCNNGCTVNLKNLGYCSTPETQLDKYLKQYERNDPNDCLRCYKSAYISENDFNNIKDTYEKFYHTYIEACYYISYIKNKIEYIKTSSLSARTSNICVRFHPSLFKNLKNGELKKIYSGQGVLGIYNSLIQRRR